MTSGAVTNEEAAAIAVADRLTAEERERGRREVTSEAVTWRMREWTGSMAGHLMAEERSELTDSMAAQLMAAAKKGK